MTIFEFADYKLFVNARVKAMPKKGHGQWLKIAQSLEIHTTMVSQIFRGPLNLSLEHAQQLAEFFGLSELETDYFMILVQLERAGSHSLKAYYRKQAEKLKERALNLSERLQFDRVLDEKSQALFYSNWFYSGIRLLTAIPGLQNRDAIAEFLGLSKAQVNRVIEFLLSVGLCAEKDDKLSVGQSRTYVGRDSLLVSRHHTNWRMRVLQQVDSLAQDELMFTNPIAVSAEDFSKIREDLVRAIEGFRKTADESPSEQLACLNLDWVRIRKPGE